tara:strand:- start:18286 stop:20583 length:2298 start_codon:yes stop_codon:yes gene_type:complete
MKTEWITKKILNKIRLNLPSMSETEKIALEAGSVWWDKSLLSGQPEWKKFFETSKPELTEEENNFINNEVEEVCSMVQEWKVNHESKKVPEPIWNFIKKKRFLSMIIPKKYGGLQFSAYAQSQVITKLATRSSALSVMVMVPNSLGPGELLVHYGTEKQKNHYLPKLSIGEEIPAFALTSPWAGSDASSIPDYGIICEETYLGKKTLGIKVTWNKRYITLAPICSVLGLAFKAFDPNNLLGKKKELGITCALIPSKHPGVEIGSRHMPLTVQWPNGPTTGNDVFIPLDFVIGEKKGVGNGWRMLMECLAAGRAISLPSSNAGIAKLTLKTVGGYSRVRQQFKTPIANFEGINAALGKIIAKTYIIDSTRKLAAAAIDAGERPSVISAIAKVHATENAREVVNLGMDVLGGKGICHGPSNFLAEAHIQTPISITVEGANLLTKSLIIFGQGAIRCHPHLLKVMECAQNPNQQDSQKKFDEVFKEMTYTLSKNILRSFSSSLLFWFKAIPTGSVDPFCKNFIKRTDQYSAAFSVVADYFLFTLAGRLKRKELLSGRLGDILSNLFMISACLKHHEDIGRPKWNRCILNVSCKLCLQEIEEAFNSLFANIDSKASKTILKFCTFPIGVPNNKLSDGELLAAGKIASVPSEARDYYTAEVFWRKKLNEEDLTNEPVSAIEQALLVSKLSEPIESKIRTAEKRGRFRNNPKANVKDIALEAFKEKIISEEEFNIVNKLNILRDLVIGVDEFDKNMKLSRSKKKTPLPKAA